MKIDAVTNTPKALVDAINKAITDENLKTWAIVYNDKKELLYSHTPQQWAEKAMMKPSIKEDRVTFLVSWWSKNGDPGKEVSGYILGRFTEILVVHFRNYFSRLETTA